jgi:hypothetical protein
MDTRKTFTIEDLDDPEVLRWAMECYKKATAEVAESRRLADLPLENLRAAWKAATDHQRAAFLDEVGGS